MTALPNEKPYTTADVEALPEGRRAELIGGDMHMLATPTRVHQKIVARILTRILNQIEAEHMPCEAYPAPFAVYIGGSEDHYNYVEPDISVICDESKLTDKGCAGAPDWIIEIVSPCHYMSIQVFMNTGLLTPTAKRSGLICSMPVKLLHIPENILLMIPSLCLSATASGSVSVT